MYTDVDLLDRYIDILRRDAEFEGNIDTGVGSRTMRVASLFFHVQKIQEEPCGLCMCVVLCVCGRKLAKRAKENINTARTRECVWLGAWVYECMNECVCFSSIYLPREICEGQCTQCKYDSKAPSLLDDDLSLAFRRFQRCALICMCVCWVCVRVWVGVVCVCAAC